MKNFTRATAATLLILLLIFLLTSCQKEDSTPDIPGQAGMVHYYVECDDCIVYIPEPISVDSVWKKDVPYAGQKSITLQVYTSEYKGVIASIAYSNNLAGFGAFINGSREVTLNIK